MTVSEFPAFAEAALIVDRLDGHRQRQVLAFMAERYGWSLKPSAKKTAATPSPNNRSEFAAMEEVADLLDGLTAAQHGQGMALFASRYGAEVAASYKPPSKGFAPRRKRSM